jgi:hypothetical protein
MFLTIVSASLIAIGFFGTATHFGGGFVVFVLALLTSLWVLGFFTFVRILQGRNDFTLLASWRPSSNALTPLRSCLARDLLERLGSVAPPPGSSLRCRKECDFDL